MRNDRNDSQATWDRLYALACARIECDAGIRTVYVTLWDANQACVTPLPGRELRALIESAVRQRLLPIANTAMNDRRRARVQARWDERRMRRMQRENERSMEVSHA